MNIKTIIKRLNSSLRVYKKNRNNQRDYTVWIFGEWFGNKCSDNALAFANYVAKNSDQELKLYWICKDGIDTSYLDPRVRIVLKESEQAIVLQQTAGVAIMNQGYDDFSDYGNNYLGNAITVNLWHGIMWKKIGYDSYSKNIITQLFVNSIYKTKQYSFFCATSEKYKQFFMRAFRCVDSTNAIETGLPRNSFFYDKESINLARKKTINHITKLGIFVDENVKIITYMPTFRDKKLSSFSFETITDNALSSFIRNNNCIIVQKAHEVNVKRGTGFGNGSNNCIVNIDSIPPQELLASTDVLITDYSSCFFDFLLLDRPIIQYIYDYDYYSQKDRGLYYGKEDVDCGAVVMDEKSLIEAIIENVLSPEKHKEERARVRKRFMNYEGPNSNQVIFDAIIKRIQEIKAERK